MNLAESATLQNPLFMKVGMAFTQRHGAKVATHLAQINNGTREFDWQEHHGLGASQHAWAGFNLGDHVNDAPQAVQANRTQLQQLIRHPIEIVRQVHGTQVCVVQQAGDALACQEGADALVTRVPGLALVMLVADCLPVLFHSSRHQVVAAAHAGWRGLAAGILENTLQTMAQQGQCSTSDLCQDLQVWLGPCIGPNAFEVGPEVIEAFVNSQGKQAVSLAMQSALQPAAQERGACALLNLPQLARLRLQNMGVALRNIGGNNGSAPWCTFDNEALFFSHRRSTLRGEGACGRMAACIWLEPHSRS